MSRLVFLLVYSRKINLSFLKKSRQKTFEFNMKFNQGWFFCLCIEEKSTFLFCKKVVKKLLGWGFIISGLFTLLLLSIYGHPTFF